MSDDNVTTEGVPGPDPAPKGKKVPKRIVEMKEQSPGGRAGAKTMRTTSNSTMQRLRTERLKGGQGKKGPKKNTLRGGKDYVRQKNTVHQQYLAEDGDKVLEALRMQAQAATRGYYEVPDPENPDEIRVIAAGSFDEMMAAGDKFIRNTVGQPSKDMDNNSIVTNVLVAIEGAIESVKKNKDHAEFEDFSDE